VRCRSNPATIARSSPRQGRTTKATSAWVPNSTRLSLRTWGKAPSPRGPAEGRPKAAALATESGTSRTVPVEAHQAQPLVERPRRLGPPQRADDPTEEVPHRRHPQPPPRHAEVRAARRLLAGAEPSGMLEDLADRQVRQEPHREHDPEDDLGGQDAIARGHAPGRRQRLVGGSSGRIICSSPANRSKIRPASSAGSVHRPRGMRVAASWLPRF